MKDSDPAAPDTTGSSASGDAAWLHIDVAAAADGATVQLAVAGELDRMSCPQLEDAVGHVLEESVPAVLQIDASRVTFLDSNGVRCLLICRGRSEEAGCRLVVTDPPPAVRHVLEITGLLDVFGVPRVASDGGGHRRSRPARESHTR